MYMLNSRNKNERTKNIMKDNRGASLVTVLITIGFVGVLLSMVLMITLVNFKMKRVNAYAKDTFYSAEQVLDEINIGLQRYVSDSLTAAYREVMESYTDYTIAEKEEILKTAYYESMWAKLEADASHHTYSTDALQDAFLKDSTKWRGDDTDGYGAVLRVTQADGSLGTTGEMITYDKSGIVLKNLRVYYKDSKGYVSVIETDIRIAYPQFSFASSTALPDLPEYSIIADEGIVTTTNIGGEIDVTGSIYADSLKVSIPDNIGKLKINHTGAGKVIFKHKMDLDNASFSAEENVALWAEDIVADSSSVTLIGETNIANDLNIKGNASKITLKGTYNGYGNSLTESDKSSAILINGSNSELDMSDIEKITVAGHAYVGTKSANLGSLTATERGAGENVYTGESIAIKSNQILYLVPGECIGVDRETLESRYRKNPLTASEYAEIMDGEKYHEIYADMYVDKLEGDLSYYIRKQNGVAMPEKVFIPTNNETMVYYYMTFESEKHANEYFNKYYGNNKEQTDKYASYYATLLDFPDTASLNTVKFAGNGLEKAEDDTFELKSDVVTDAAGKMEDNRKTYGNQFTALCTKLISSYGDLTGLVEAPNPNGQIVFENVINETKMTEYISNASGGVAGMNAVLDGADGKVVLAEGYYEVTDPDIHLVIAKGDVKISVQNFEGLVFANGEVEIPHNTCVIKANPDKVRNMLRYHQTVGAQNVMVASILNGGEEFAFSVGGEVGSNISALKDLIVYENWKKE